MRLGLLYPKGHNPSCYRKISLLIIDHHSSKSIQNKALWMMKMMSTNSLSSTSLTTWPNLQNNNNNIHHSNNNSTSATMKTQTIISTALLSTSSLSTNNNNNHKHHHNNKPLSTAFQPWPKSMVECKGDYSQETYIEDIISNNGVGKENIGNELDSVVETSSSSLYSMQSELPHLPIPSIDETIKLFLSSALPLAKSDTEKELLKKDCEVFPTQVRELQKKLHARRNDCSRNNTSWLQCWWNQLMYLQYREPNVVNVSYFFQLDDDKTLPIPSSIEEIYNHDNNYKLGIKRAAAVLTAMAEYRKLVCSGTLPVERIGKEQKPLCSTSFKYMFHSCRIPKESSDTYHIYDPSLYNHCIVACKGQFYSMDFVTEDEDPLPLQVLENGLELIVELAKEDSVNVPEFGILTSGNRDVWAKSRDLLLTMGGDSMKKAMTLLESGAFVLCLDDSVPVTNKECASIYFHGNKVSGSNRWFDKSINVLCQANGKLGFMGEHSLMDGMPAVGLCEHIKSRGYGKVKEECKEYIDTSLPKVENVFKNAILEMNSNTIENLIHQARLEYNQLVEEQDLDFLSFQAYGRDFIKKSGYYPDGLVQMALQVASFRLFGKQVGTYESSQTRAFLHGRTETIRSVSEASEAFVKAMGTHPIHNDKDNEIRKKKLSLLREATEYHSKYVKNAASGLGVDRHFFGLSMVTTGNEDVSLFSNPLFALSKTWRLSTSTLPNKPGFGPVVEDGIGVAYEIKSDCCYFTITSRKKNGYSEAFCHLLEESLIEIQTLINLDNPPKSKL